MDGMTILLRVYEAKDDIARIQQKIDQRYDAAQSIVPQGMGTGGGTGDDKMASFAADIDRLEREKTAREQQQSAELAAACVLLDTLPKKESSVLHHFYIKREKIEVIAQKLTYSSGYVRTLKTSGEKKMRAIPMETLRASMPAWYAKEIGL